MHCCKNLVKGERSPGIFLYAFADVKEIHSSLRPAAPSPELPKPGRRKGCGPVVVFYYAVSGEGF